eukprot:246629-Chlamydomonas_euryale.AAC.1
MDADFLTACDKAAGLRLRLESWSHIDGMWNTHYGLGRFHCQSKYKPCCNACQATSHIISALHECDILRARGQILRKKQNMLCHYNTLA